MIPWLRSARAQGGAVGERSGRLEQEVGGRFAGLDRVRGLAVALMLLDHVLAVFDLTTFRGSVTRLSLPLFALCIGALAVKPLSNRRRVEWLAAALLVQPLYVLAGINGPLLLLWLALGRLVARQPVALRLAMIAGALTIYANGNVDVFMGEYAPLGVIGLVALGVGQADRLDRIGCKLRPAGLLGLLGRFALPVYVAHLAVLAIAVTVA